MKSTNRFLLLLSIFYLFSCHKENSIHMKFPVEITDTVSEYRIYFYVRLNNEFKGDSIPMVITVMTPDSLRFRDTVSFYLAEKEKNIYEESIKTGVWRDFRWLYRDGVVFHKSGKWDFTVKHLSTPDNLQAIRDIGITVKKK